MTKGLLRLQPFLRFAGVASDNPPRGKKNEGE
jgi:hypothetical protein